MRPSATSWRPCWGRFSSSSAQEAAPRPSMSRCAKRGEENVGTQMKWNTWTLVFLLDTGWVWGEWK